MKQVVTSSRVAAAPAMNTLVAGALIASLLMVEGAVLSLHGQGSTVVPLAMVLVASTVSSIIGFAFSALCGALLFHVIDSPVYAVQVMIVCSIAIQLLCVAALWHSIDWRSLPVFLIGGLPGRACGRLASDAPADGRLSRCPRRPADRLWRLAAAASADAGRCAGGRWRTSARASSAASPAGLPAFPARPSRSGAA